MSLLLELYLIYTTCTCVLVLSLININPYVLVLSLINNNLINIYPCTHP